MSEDRFYQLYRQHQAAALNARALREHEQHRTERPLCHESRADVGNCRCSCGGIYHGGRLPIYSADQVDDTNG